MSKLITSKEYNLPDENAELEIDMAAHKLYSALFEIKQQIRAIWKYEEIDREVQEKVNEIYQMVCDQCYETGVEI